MGLSDRVISVNKNSPAGKNRYIYLNGKLHPLPNSFMSMVFKRPPFSKSMLSVALSEARMPGSDEFRGKDESIYSFVSRRMGKEVGDI